VQTTSHESGFSITRLIFHSRLFQILWIFLFLLALFFYYRWQIPLRFVAKNLIPLPAALIHVLALIGLGWPFMKLIVKKEEKWIEVFVSLAFGIGLTGIFSFSLGMTAHLELLPFILWEVAGWILFLIALNSWWPLSVQKVPWNIWNVLGAAILLLFLVAEIPFVVAPEISTDAIAYHLLIPKMYLARGEIYFLPLFVEAYYPSLAELNYLPLLQFANEFVCKAFHFWGGICVLILLAQIIKRVRPDSGRWLAPALFLSMPMTALHIAWAWNDFFYTFFVLLSLLFFLRYEQGDKSSGRDLFIAGILAGLSSWMKYTFVLFFFASVVLLIVGNRRWKWKLRHYPLLFVGIGLIASFWMLQNWIFTDNPFYPFLNKIFHSPFWTENADRNLHNSLRRWEISNWSWKTYFTFPIHMMLKPRLVDIQTGILPLVLIPLFFMRAKSAGLRLLKVYIAGSILAWLLIHTENRSLFTVFGVFFCIVTILLESFPFIHKKIRFLLGIGIVLASCTNFFYASLTMYDLFDPFRYFFGRETASEYRTRLSESQVLFDYLNNSRDAKRVLLVSSHVPYYLNHPALFSSFADPPITEVLTYELKSSSDLDRKLRALEVTHIVFNKSAYEKENKVHLYSWSHEQRLLFEEFVLRYCEPVIRSGSDYVFRIK
jgi:Dolichyl-phosphate-mannose-protein mannosyltransferase